MKARSAPDDGMKFCADCGEPIARTAEICPRCGVRQIAARSSGNKILKGCLLVLLIPVAVIAMGIAAAIAIPKFAKTKDKAYVAAQTTAANDSDLTSANTASVEAMEIPAPTGLLNDFAHVISPDEAKHIEAIAADMHAKTRGEMAIVTLPDIGTRDVQEVALQIGREWKVGKIGNPADPARNVGVVILLVPKETSKDGRGHCFIATGRGAERFMTDADAGDICRRATPAFMRMDYSTGLELVASAAARRFR